MKSKILIENNLESTIILKGKYWNNEEERKRLNFILYKNYNRYCSFNLY